MTLLPRRVDPLGNFTYVPATRRKGRRVYQGRPECCVPLILRSDTASNGRT